MISEEVVVSCIELGFKATLPLPPPVEGGGDLETSPPAGEGRERGTTT